MSKVDLVLVNPGNKSEVYGRLGGSLSASEPPLWTGLIAGFIRDRGFSVKVIDAEALSWDPAETAREIGGDNPVLAAISAIGANPSASSTPKMPAAGRILSSLKEGFPHIKTALYGIHPSALPEKTLKSEDVDFICRGEAFYTILELLKALKSGDNSKDYNIKGLWYMRDDEVVPGGWGKLVSDINELPFVAWDLLPMDRYRAHNWHCFGRTARREHYAVIYTSLGCPYSCTYCNIHALYNGKPRIRFRKPELVVQEIDLLVKKYKVRNIKILDEIFVLREDRVIRFCDLIIKCGYDLNMWAYARVDTVSEKILDKMKKAGINWICYGIESGSKRVRDDVVKGKFGEDTIKNAIRMTHDAGIHVIGNFMFGLPEDSTDTMQRTLDLATELNCEYVNFYTTMAYPGSRLYDEVVKQNIDLPGSWLGYSQFSRETLPLPTRHLSGAEVLDFRDRAFETYYNNPRYIKMIQDKFGGETADHIREMLRYKIKRDGDSLPIEAASRLLQRAGCPQQTRRVKN